MRVSILKPLHVGVDLARDDDGVNDFVVRVVHGKHVEATATDVLRIDDRVQEPSSPVGAPHDESRSIHHVSAKVRNHLGLVLGRHADERGQEDHVVLAELVREVGDVGGVEEHLLAQALVRADQLSCTVVGSGAPVVVVEHHVRQVAGGEHERAERQGVGPDEGDSGRCDARDIADQEV
uniref:Uncharacterized protein n=1 Tax=Zea mays TaxID=4577 RepID=A0A804LJ21_MAIZE